MQSDRTLPALALALALALAQTTPSVAQHLPTHPTYVPSGMVVSADSVIQANDNRAPAGTWNGDTLVVVLDVRRGVLYPNGEPGPGVRAEAFAEAGRPMSVPGPLLRVPQGTTIDATVRNALPDSSITLFGFARRPSATPDSVRLAPGESTRLTFTSGQAGTYLYGAIIGGTEIREVGERETAAGAFIVDPAEGALDDRVLVINIWSQPDSTYEHGAFETLLINGRSFPDTERMVTDVGEAQSWHVINASRRVHPMHLHGFYYDVLARGTATENHALPDSLVQKVVTEVMRGQTTMYMRWVPEREGAWLFHCHLSFHVSPNVQLPDGKMHHNGHMAGLVMGIDVQPGPSDLIERGEPRHLTLHTLQFDDNPLHRYAFAFDPVHDPDSTVRTAPGPVLVMRQYEPTFVTVKNGMDQPAGVHWHGLELDAWADGVPDFSASHGKMSPAIAPADSFTYKLTLMRPGTFMYHSHLNDIDQLRGGLYGAIVVLGEEEVFNPETDHVYMWGRRRYRAQSFQEALGANGTWEQPDITTTAGTTHRLRLAVMAPVTAARFLMTKDGQPYPLLAIAKDGADFPPAQRTNVMETRIYREGETADFLFTPLEPGTYELQIGPVAELSVRQRWLVTAALLSGK
ncbi:MAG: multicopper oxidase domain-containing protein [Rhodothermales bacterium]